jgi:hypothetical protein
MYFIGLAVKCFRYGSAAADTGAAERTPRCGKLIKTKPSKTIALKC